MISTDRLYLFDKRLAPGGPPRKVPGNGLSGRAGWVGGEF